MSKERLKEAKQIMKDIKKFQKNFNHKQADLAKLFLVEKYGDWLIEQAERVDELEDKLDIIRFVNNDYDKQNKRYREALEKIARINIEQGTVTVSEVHAVLTARKALEGEE